MTNDVTETFDSETSGGIEIVRSAKVDHLPMHVAVFTIDEYRIINAAAKKTILYFFCLKKITTNNN